MANRTKEEMQFDFLEWCEKERKEAAEQLSRFEAGLSKFGMAGPSGYVDSSAKVMDHLRGIIASMDELIPKVRADLKFID